MATIVAPPGVEVDLGIGLVGNVNSDVADRGVLSGPATLRLDTTAGSTPTVTANIQGSADGVNWFNVAYALVGTPTSQVVAALTITSTVVTTYLIAGGYGWRFLRVAFTANTNVTINHCALLAH